MAIRFVKRDDYERVIQLDTYCFPWLNDFKDKVRDFIDRYVPDEAILGYYDESNVLSAMLFILPFEIYIYGSIFSMGGIASVSSMPETRHGGKVAELLKSSLRIMKERGQAVSMLGPFSYEFYRKYGWELGFDRLNYTIPAENLDGFKKIGNIKPFEEKDLDILNDIYTEYAKRHNCCTVRNKILWTDFVLQDPYGRNHPRYAYIWFNDQGEPRGYIVYSIRDNRLNITEMIYLDQEAKDGLLWFLFVHQSQIKEVYWSTAPDERLHLDFPNPRIKMELSPWMMFRVVDVKGALINRRYSGDIDTYFSISIYDPNAEWNNKSFSITIKDENIEVEEIDSGELSCNIQTFSQIFTGYVTPKEAFTRRRLLGNASAVEKMEKIFEKSYTFNNNPF